MKVAFYLLNDDFMRLSKVITKGARPGVQMTDWNENPPLGNESVDFAFIDNRIWDSNPQLRSLENRIAKNIIILEFSEIISSHVGSKVVAPTAYLSFLKMVVNGEKNQNVCSLAG